MSQRFHLFLITALGAFGTSACSMILNKFQTSVHHLQITSAATTVFKSLSLEESTDASVLQGGRRGDSSVQLNDGRFLFVGDAGLNSDLVEFYEKDANGGNGAFVPAASLNVGRYGATITKLSDGRVLVAGGVSATSVVLSSVEIFDPLANSGNGAWQLVAPMSTDRRMHMAGLLPNGKVIVAGGFSAGVAAATSEIFDPSANAGLGSWTPAPSMSVVRLGSSSVMLNDGRFMVASGFDLINSVHDVSTEFFDYTGNAGAGAWTAGPNMAVGREQFSMVPLSDGKIFIYGGVDDANQYTKVAELFDPSAGVSGTFTTLASSTAGRAYAAPIELPDGRVLVSGGYLNNNFGTVGKSTEIYDRGLNSWSAGPDMISTRRLYNVVIINGKAHVFGGMNLFAVRNRSVEILDLSANAGAGDWTLKVGDAQARYNHAATKLNDGRILVSGGNDSNDQTVIRTASIFNPEHNLGAKSWQTAPALNQARTRHTSTILQDGRVLVCGGLDGLSFGLTSSEIFDPAANSGAGEWTIGPSMHVYKYDANAVLLNDGRVLVVGGNDGANKDATEIFDPSQNSGAGAWQSGPPLNFGRSRFEIAKLIDGRVIVSGGFVNGTTQDSVEIFDPAGNSGAGTWSVATSMTMPRLNHRMVQLSDGRVIVVGGLNGGTLLDTIDVFDPLPNGGLGSWSQITTMPVGRYSHNATVLKDGRLYISGGNNLISNLATSAFYDVENDSWSAGPTSKFARVNFKTIALDDGSVVDLQGQGLNETSLTTFFEPVEFVIHNGVAPFTAQITSGQGHLYVAGSSRTMSLRPTALGPVEISVTDAKGKIGSIRFDVSE